MTGRAITPEQKRAIVERLLAAWLRAPELRFGQMLTAAADRAERDTFYIEDEALCEAVEALAPREPTPDENFAALKHFAPSLAAVHERAAAKHGVHPWNVSEEQLWEECPALRPADR